MNRKHSELSAELCACFRGSAVRFITDRGVVTVSDDPVENGEAHAETPYAEATVQLYGKGGKTLYRGLSLLPKTDLTLYRVEADTCLPDGDWFLYRSFIDAPTAVFARTKDSGYLTGIENPFFDALPIPGGIRLTFEPSLLLKTGERYDSEPQFLRRCRLTGRICTEREPVTLTGMQKGIRRPRFYQPIAERPLDYGEIDAMRDYVREYFGNEPRFDNILYFFFYPKKQYPQTEEEIADYLDTIDRFAAIRGDIAAFNPHVNTEIPTVERPFWELAPEGSAAERILHHAQKKGLRCGYYMGCAFNGGGGNAALLPYRPEKKSWKKVDFEGHTASENCLACDEYLDWWFSVQKNTIEKYHLGYWSWDPGPGNGCDCYAANHGHLPGKGEYKGWRNSERLLKRLRDSFPELFLMSFYGRKEYGLWGFRYFSQHEVYWEQTLLFGATLHADLHDDRMTAHGIRLQNQWSMNFRFLPAELGHGLVTRMGESCFEPTLDRAVDETGWRYALLSAIACCGSVTHCNLPDRLDRFPGFRAFYEKWIPWAKANVRFIPYTKPLAESVGALGVDGFSRIDGRNGQIFLFSSSPKVLHYRLCLDESIGLTDPEPFWLRILCDSERNPEKSEEQDVSFGGMYHTGESLNVTLPPYGALVLEITREKMKQAEILPRRIRTLDVFRTEDGTVFPYPRHASQTEIILHAGARFPHEIRDVIEAQPQDSSLTEQIERWRQMPVLDSLELPFTLIGAERNRLILFLPFAGPTRPDEVRLRIGSRDGYRDVPVRIFRLRGIAVSLYADLKDAILWDEELDFELRIRNLPANSFLGGYVELPERCPCGILTEERIFEAQEDPAELHVDPTLRIRTLRLLPDALSRDAVMTVEAETDVPPEQIEEICCVLPTVPEMPSMTYDPASSCWRLVFPAGRREGNIFCNPYISAWIRAKDGGVGPRFRLPVSVRYTP